MIDHDEFTRQYNAHAKAIVKYMSFKFGSQAEDYSASAWMKAWKHREQFNGESSFKTWVMTIAVNHGMQESRALRGPSALLTLPILPKALHDGNAVERGIIAADTLAHIMGRVPAKDMQIFHMRYILRLSVGEVSQATRVKVSTIKSRMRRALEKVR